MENVFSLDEGDNIRRVKGMFLVHGIGLRGENGIVIAISVVKPRDIDAWKVIGLRKLESQLGWIPLAKRERHEEIQLVGVAQPHLVGHARANRPNLSHLRILSTDVI